MDAFEHLNASGIRPVTAGAGAETCLRSEHLFAAHFGEKRQQGTIRDAPSTSTSITTISTPGRPCFISRSLNRAFKLYPRYDIFLRASDMKGPPTNVLGTASWQKHISLCSS
jgi:hypothetical protein